ERFAGAPQLAPLLLATGVAAGMLGGVRVHPGVPFSLLAVAAATVIAKLAGLEVATIGALPEVFKAPDLGFISFAHLRQVVPAALAIAALAALESLLSATVADGMS